MDPSPPRLCLCLCMHAPSAPHSLTHSLGVVSRDHQGQGRRRRRLHKSTLLWCCCSGGGERDIERSVVSKLHAHVCQSACLSVNCIIALPFPLNDPVVCDTSRPARSLKSPITYVYVYCHELVFLLFILSAKKKKAIPKCPSIRPIYGHRICLMAMAD